MNKENLDNQDSKNMSKKTICIGDIHGRDIWKDIIVKESPDRIIFIGDYFDTRDNITPSIQMYNFQEIIALKRTGMFDLIMLIGNHDYHYFPEIGYNGTSGYQSGAAHAISNLINENRKHLQVAYEMNNILFTHAGVSETFLKHATELLGETDDDMSISQKLNLLFKYKPWAFAFNGTERTGDNITQSCIWIRSKSLAIDSQNLAKSIIQVVGHTSMKSIYKDPSSRYYFIDTLGTSKQYLVINNDLITINQV